MFPGFLDKCKIRVFNFANAAIISILVVEETFWKVPVRVWLCVVLDMFLQLDPYKFVRLLLPLTYEPVYSRKNHMCSSASGQIPWETSNPNSDKCFPYIPKHVYARLYIGKIIILCQNGGDDDKPPMLNRSPSPVFYFVRSFRDLIMGIGIAMIRRSLEILNAALIHA